MEFSTPQGVSSPTFKQPPLDGTLLLPQVMDFHAEHSPSHPLFVYADADNENHTISWSRAVKAFHRVAHIVRKHADLSSRPAVAILASADTITYWSVIAGILRAGCRAFPISTRNSDAAIAHLLQATACAHVFVSADAAMQKLVAAATTHIQATKGVIPALLPMPTFTSLYEANDDVEPLPPLDGIGLDDPAIILHSSGSTVFPKLITSTYRILMESGLIPYHGQVDVCGEVLTVRETLDRLPLTEQLVTQLHPVPMFHLMGVLPMIWTVFAGLTVAVFPPMFPPMAPTSVNVFAGAVATDSTLMYCVPTFLESWAREPVYVAALNKFKAVIFVGGPLQSAVGDMLAENGVKLAHIYGQTEISCVTLFLTKSPPAEGWEYFLISSHVNLAFIPVEGTPGVYRLFAKKWATHTPAVLNTTIDGVPALNTNDLLCRHPVNPDLWKVYGRQDDQIIHSNGEKTNPFPIEAILLNNPALEHAIMFGHSQFHAGVIVFPAHPIDPTDTQQVADFRRKIWTTVNEANRFAPANSRIFKEMILIADPAKPVMFTPKRTLRRQAIIDMYSDEITDLYEAVRGSSQTHLRLPTVCDAASSLKFMREVVAEVMRELPDDDDDIFQHGCDSLQATWICNSILHALRDRCGVDVNAIPTNFVYAHPTVRLLAELLTALAAGEETSPCSEAEALAMAAMAQKYSRSFPVHREHVTLTAAAVQPTAHTVLITGTTGALGAHLLARLLALPGVIAVYALNRPRTDVLASQRSVFAENGLDARLADDPALRLLEGDLNAPSFGLARGTFEAMRAAVTHIVHNAWQVNFNVSLASMEPLVAGTRQLIDFALSSLRAAPPRLLFVSSVGVFRRWTGTTVATEDPIPDPEVSAGQGYAASKWVAETVLGAAARTTALKPVIVRAGQLSGAANGAWNFRKWFPALLRTSQLLGRLPAVSGCVSWVPIHQAAGAIVEIMIQDSEARYLHLTHPHPVPFATLLVSLAEIPELPVVPYSAWLNSLEAEAAHEAETGLSIGNSPGVRLMEFFRAVKNSEGAPEQEAFFRVAVANARAVEVAESLAALPSLAAVDVKLWVAHLRRGGHLL